MVFRRKKHKKRHKKHREGGFLAVVGEFLVGILEGAADVFDGFD